ncbi:PTS lactose/cellobiose transporter subunit IIA [Alkalihalobacillus pseudalcaliphilus]|uniref:PTS lactose/cellobiose transporter subunit IIA n=1 Tax=Alkalihalobacillus pseudalcaliphilus TaxID=79884 RepID=UPI00064E0AED|nr:PTS lactose/cellobiose transporter subunit IIA [Alkalihalobacillus pseudalcaliphilus]KMK75519.1 hypothetical protein AB990_09480 [Alkalihalobacillus pseudalcaliphilus]
MELNEQLAFSLILHAGEGKSLAFSALQKAKKGEFEQAKMDLEASKKEISKAHQQQTKLISSNSKQLPSLLLIHAQDHVMNAMNSLELITELIDMHHQLQTQITPQKR